MSKSIKEQILDELHKLKNQLEKFCYLNAIQPNDNMMGQYKTIDYMLEFIEPLVDPVPVLKGDSKPIVAKTILSPRIKAFDPDDQPLGELNEYELNDLRIQIKTNKAEGYYVLSGAENSKIYIDTNGKFDGYPVELELFENQLDKLL